MHMVLDILLLHSMSVFWCFFWFALLPLLIGALIGWLLAQGRIRRLSDQLATTRGDLDRTKAELNQTSSDLSTLKYQYEELEKENQQLRTRVGSLRGDVDVLTTKLKEIDPDILASGALGLSSAGAGVDFGLRAQGIAWGDLFTNDNLQVVEGIGPKVEEVLKANGINNWSDLAATSEDRLRQVLTDAGLAITIASAGTWPRQAELARDGKWAELLEYQKFLDDGREGAGSMDSPAKIEALAFKILGFSSSDPDDLKIVEGIGPKIEALLKANGINNWSDLAATDEERLQSILDQNESFRLAKPKTWPKQAQLAAEGKWSELKEYQDFLLGGTDPTA